MKVKVRQKKNAVILDLEGNIDINSSQLVETVGKVINKKISNIVFNFEGIKVIDYVGISLIAVVYKNIINHNAHLKIYKVPVSVRKLFSLVGLNRVFKYYDTQEVALKAFDNDKKTLTGSKEQLRRRFKRISLNADILYRRKSTADKHFLKEKL